MDGSIVQGLSAILIVLPALANKKDKAKIGKALVKLYINIDALYQDGIKLNKQLEKVKNQNQTRLEEILTLTYLQASRINEIKAIIKNSRLEKLLKIHLPAFKNITVYIEGKGERIAFLQDEFETQQKYRFMHPITLDKPIMHTSFIRWAKLIKPSKNAINKSKADLQAMKKINDKLRLLLVKSFDINDII